MNELPRIGIRCESLVQAVAFALQFASPEEIDPVALLWAIPNNSVFNPALIDQSYHIMLKTGRELATYVIASHSVFTQPGTDSYGRAWDKVFKDNCCNYPIADLIKEVNNG